MTGAIVPDDWDGSTYKCYQVQWPHSEQYEAILLGNISKPSFLDYWDAGSGDAQEAANAVKTAYRNTVPDFWAEDCEEKVEATKSFRVRRDGIQSIPSGIWTKVLYDEYVWNLQAPGWNMPENAQDMTIPANAGIWQYNAGIRINKFTDIYLGVQLNNSHFICISQAAASNRCQLNVSWDVNATWTWLNVWVLVGTTGVETLNIPDFTNWFSGHLVKPVEV